MKDNLQVADSITELASGMYIKLDFLRVFFFFQEICEFANGRKKKFK